MNKCTITSDIMQSNMQYLHDCTSEMLATTEDPYASEAEAKKIMRLCIFGLVHGLLWFPGVSDETCSRIIELSDELWENFF